MKNCIALFVLAILFSSCNSSTPETKTPPSQVEKVTNTRQETTAEAVVMEMTIEGMVCAMGCAAVIEKRLNKTLGVTKATVDFASKKAVVEFNPNALTSTGIVGIVKSVGEAYSVSTFSILE